MAVDLEDFFPVIHFILIVLYLNPYPFHVKPLYCAPITKPVTKKI
jgi:hypothetical protein